MTGADLATLRKRALGEALAAIANGADADYAMRLSASVAERFTAEEHLREEGISPSPADVEAWIAASPLQKRKLRELWGVMRATEALRNS